MVSIENNTLCSNQHSQNQTTNGINLTEYAETQSQVLVFSVAGRLGSGASFVAEKIRDGLHGYKYDVKMIEVSTLIMAAVLEIESDFSDKNNDDSFHDNIRSNFSQRYPKKINVLKSFRMLETRYARKTAIPY